MLGSDAIEHAANLAFELVVRRAINLEVAAKGVAHGPVARSMRGVVRQQVGLAFTPQRLGALEMMGPHDQDHVLVLDDLARELAGAVSAQVDAALEGHEQAAIRRRRAVPGARTGARDLEVDQAAFDRLATRDTL